MNIYLVTSHKAWGRDTYDSFVCVAKSPLWARREHPSNLEGSALSYRWAKTGWILNDSSCSPDDSSWVPARHVDRLHVEKIGFASPRQKVGVICSSFNAG